MPIITKTARSSSDYNSDENCGTAESMAKAIAAASGSTYNVVEGSTASDYTSYVPMQSIGYSDWCVVIGSKNNISFKILKVKGDGTPDFDDTYAASLTFSTTDAETANTLFGQPETCVMIYDKNKDTVLFDVHPGLTSQGTDLGTTRANFIAFTFFFAKDINGDVLCGLGNGHIRIIRTKTDKMEGESSFYATPLSSEGNPGDVLHLTKMVNYLSPGCPEMKSAYVSVVRPFESVKDKKYISSLYSNGKRWARAGLIDSWNAASTSDKPVCCCYQPIEPFVNY